MVNIKKHKIKLDLQFFLLVVVVLLFAAITTTSTYQSKITTSTQALSIPNCSFDSGQAVELRQTETDATNAEPRWPISTYPYEYDVFNTSYFTPIPNNDAGILNLTKSDGGAVDSNMNNFMGSMFGFKPKTLSAAYDMKYNSAAARGNDPSEIKGVAPVLEVAVNPDDPIVKAPDTGYNFGGMVVFATQDRITLHIGIHEYFVGSKQCRNGPCSGGYWISIKNICVDKQILDKYNSVKGAQLAAGADLNPIQLPYIGEGRIIGKAQGGNKIVVGVRDNGPFISTYKPVYWGGVPEKDYNSGGQATPTNNPTPTTGGVNPPPTTPTTGPGGVNPPPPSSTPTNIPTPSNTPTPIRTPNGTNCNYGTQCQSDCCYTNLCNDISMCRQATCSVYEYKCPDSNRCVPIANKSDCNPPTPTPTNTPTPTPKSSGASSQTQQPPIITPTPIKTFFPFFGLNNDGKKTYNLDRDLILPECDRSNIKIESCIEL